MGGALCLQLNVNNVFGVCEECSPGSYVPAGSVGVCEDFAACPADAGGVHNPSSRPCADCGAGHHVVNQAAFTINDDCGAVRCVAGTIDDDSDETTACVQCPAGTYVPPGSAGDCADYMCRVGMTDNDEDSGTPCVACGAGTYAAGLGGSGACTTCQCQNGGWCAPYSGACTCAAGFAGLACETPDVAPPASCPAGSSDVDATAGVTCEVCPAGTYAPAASTGPCTDLVCGVGTTDHDASPLTACQACGSGLTSLLGTAVPCTIAEATCANGGSPSDAYLQAAVPRSCTDYWLRGVRHNGVYSVQPSAAKPAFNTWCDFTTGADTASAESGGGAWTMVASTAGPGAPHDVGTEVPSPSLVQLAPTGTTSEFGIYSGFVPIVQATGGLADVRFTCNYDGQNYGVDIAFHDVDWVRVVSLRCTRVRADVGTALCVCPFQYATRLTTAFDEPSDMSLNGEHAPRRTDLNSNAQGRAVRACAPYSPALQPEPPVSDAANYDEDTLLLWWAADGGAGGRTGSDSHNWGWQTPFTAVCGDAAGTSFNVWLRVRPDVCACASGFTGAGCEVPTSRSLCACDAGFTDHDNDEATPCVQCAPGAFAPAGSTGACSALACASGTSDSDWDASTPCEMCGSGAGAPAAGQAGPCVDAVAPAVVCKHGGTSQTANATPARTCSDHFAAGETTSGVFSVTPDAGGTAYNVYCDFDADKEEATGAGGGAWTLVASSSGAPPQDAADTDATTLSSLAPGSAMSGVFDGFAALVSSQGGLSDIRFTCTSDAAAGSMLVDLAFYDVNWVR